MWPWNFMQGAGKEQAADAGASATAEDPAPPKAGRKAK